MASPVAERRGLAPAGWRDDGAHLDIEHSVENRVQAFPDQSIARAAASRPATGTAVARTRPEGISGRPLRGPLAVRPCGQDPASVCASSGSDTIPPSAPPERAAELPDLSGAPSSCPYRHGHATETPMWRNTGISLGNPECDSWRRVSRARPRCPGGRRDARTRRARGSRSTPGWAGPRRTGPRWSPTASRGYDASTSRVRSPIASSRSAYSSAVTSSATCQRPSTPSSQGSSTFQSPHGSATCSPRKPQTNHRCSMCSTWLSSSIGVQPDGTRAVRCCSGVSPRTPRIISLRTQSR